MARRFNAASGEYVQFSAGDLASMDGGPSTVCILWRPTTVHSGWLIHVANDLGGQTFALNPYSDGNVWHTIGSTFHQTVPYTAGDGWRLDLWTKPDGVGQVRGHSLLLSGGPWSHTNYGDTGDAGASLPITKVLVGRHFTDTAGLNADIAAIAVVQANWSDAAIEAGNLTTGLSAWETLIGSDPAVLWRFNQADPSEDVLDLTGGGADQTWKWGTSVVSDPPGFSYLLGSVAALAAQLPSVAGSISSAASNGMNLSAMLPLATCDMDSVAVNNAILAGLLPLVQGAFAQTIAVSTPQVTATIRVRSLSAVAVPA